MITKSKLPNTKVRRVLAFSLSAVLLMNTVLPSLEDFLAQRNISLAKLLPKRVEVKAESNEPAIPSKVEVINPPGEDLDVEVVNMRVEGTVKMHQANIMNNLVQSDYKKKDYAYDGSGYDIVEIQGKKAGDKTNYQTTHDYRLNDLIEKNVFIRDILINGKKEEKDEWTYLYYYTKSLPKEIYKSELVASLIRNYEGVTDKKIEWIIDTKGPTVDAEDYAYRTMIKQDIFRNKLYVKRTRIATQYYSPTEMKPYMDRAIQLGVLNPLEIYQESFVQIVNICQNSLIKELNLNKTDNISQNTANIIKSLAERDGYKIGNASQEEAYLNEWVKKGYINYNNLSQTNYHKQVVKKDYNYETVHTPILRSDVMDYYTALRTIEDVMKKKEGYVSDQEISILNYHYDSKIDDSVPEEMQSTVKYLMAKGVIFPDDVIINHDFTLEDYTTLMYRVSNPEQRYSYKTLTLSKEDQDLITKGYRKKNLEMIDFGTVDNESKLIEGQDETVKSVVDKGAVAVEVEYVRTFLKGITHQGEWHLIKSNHTDIPLTESGVSIKNVSNGILLEVEKSKWDELLTIAKNEGASLGIRNQKGLTYIGVMQDGEYKRNAETVVTDNDYRNGKITEEVFNSKTHTMEFNGTISDSFAPYRASTITTHKEFLVEQKIYLPAKDQTGKAIKGDLSYFNWVDANKRKTYTLDDAIKQKIINVEGNPEVNGNIVTLKVRIKAPTAKLAVQFLQSAISVNKAKYPGYAAVQGLIDANGSLYVGKDFLNYFGDIDILANKALYNRVTGTYAMIVDKESNNSAKSINTLVSGNTLRRFGSKEDINPISQSGGLMYRVETVKDLLPPNAFKNSGFKSYYFGDGSGKDRVANVKTVNSNDMNGKIQSTTMQKNYVVDYKGKLYMSMNNLNYASNFVIIDLPSVIKSQAMDANIEKLPSINPNTRVIVKWNWFVPTGVYKGKGLYDKDNDYITVAEKLYQKPVGTVDNTGRKNDVVERWDTFTQISNRLLEMGTNMKAGTDNVEGSGGNGFVKSGYLVPEIVVLGDDNINAQNYIKAYLANILFKEDLIKDKSSTSLADLTKVQNFNVNKFTEKEQQLKSLYPTGHTFFTYIGGGAEDKGLKVHGDYYVTDSKGSVYQLVDNKSLKGKALNGVTYRASSSTEILMTPYQKISPLKNPKVGESYTFESNSTMGYDVVSDGKGAEGIRLMKKASEGIPLVVHSIKDKGVQMGSSIVLDELTKQINDVLIDLSLDDQKIKEQYPNHKRVYDIDNLFRSANQKVIAANDVNGKTTGKLEDQTVSDITGKISKGTIVDSLVPSHKELSNIKSSQINAGRDKKSVEQEYNDIIFSFNHKDYTYGPLNSTTNTSLTLLMYINDYLFDYQKKNPLVVVGNSRPINEAASPYKITKPINLFCPTVKLNLAHFTIYPSVTTVMNKHGSYTAAGRVAALDDKDDFINVSYTLPNFNFAEDYILKTLSKVMYIKDIPEGSQVKIGSQLHSKVSTSKAPNKVQANATLLEGTVDANELGTGAYVVEQGGQRTTTLKYINTRTNKGFTEVSSYLKVIQTEVDGKKVYTVLKTQNGLPAFNYGVNSIGDLNDLSNSRFTFNYKKYKGEIPVNLDDYLAEFLKAFKEKGQRSKFHTILNLAIQLITLLMVMLAAVYLITVKEVFKNFFIRVRDKSGWDFVKIISIGLYDLDSKPSLLRISVACLLLMLVQALMLWLQGVNQIGMGG